MLLGSARVIAERLYEQKAKRSSIFHRRRSNCCAPMRATSSITRS